MHICLPTKMVPTALSTYESDSHSPYYKFRSHSPDYKLVAT